MLNPWKASESHEEVFLQRYDWLVGWALRVTGEDREKAEDLVQEAFIQFTLARPDLGGIQNLEGYLYTIVRNLHLSDVRRAARSPVTPVGAVDYDCAEIGLRAIDPRNQLKVRDELHTICRYACLRKETSKAGSVLILRFFHGYYPGEIARIMSAPRRAVDDWLRIARREVSAHLAAPLRLTSLTNGAAMEASIRQSVPPPSPTLLLGATPLDFLAELRRMIYASRKGDCLTSERLEQLYQSPDAQPVECAVLAHIASCAACLEEVNRRLGLPSLSDRHPTDMLGPDSRSRGDEKGTTVGAKKDVARNCYRLARGVFEHSPSELHLAVNGYLLGSQKLGSGVNEQTLAVNIGEKIGFVEAFSERATRLLLLPVEPPPDGAAAQSACVTLSQGRQLTMTLRFHNAWPSLHAVYYEPLSETLADETRQATELSATPASVPIGEVESQSGGATEKEARWRSARPFRRPLVQTLTQWVVQVLARTLATLRGWARPVTITALLALALITAVIFLRSPSPVRMAADLLRDAGAYEAAVVAKPDLVVYRVLDLEERRPDDSVVVSRHRLELWRQGENGATARRVYDGYDRLVAGEWVAQGGARTVYRLDDTTVARAPGLTATLPGSGEELWQLEPSAASFSQLVADVAAARVEELTTAYLIHYEASEAARDGLVRVTLRLNKPDLRAVEQVMLVRRGGVAREHRLIEREFKQRPADSVEPKIFEPDAGLPVFKVGSDGPSPRRGIEPGNHATTAESATISALAPARLELEALYQLHTVGACVSERTEVLRTSEGGLLVRAVAETDGRKAELLRAFNSLASLPGVSVDIVTVAEALRQQIHLPAKPLVVRRVEVVKGRIPADAELRRYFANRVGDGVQMPAAGVPDLEDDIRRFANRMLERSRRALLHAWALEHFVASLTPAEVAALDAEGQSRWRLVLDAHAREVAQETAAIYDELKPVFFPSAPSDTMGSEEAAAGVAETVKRLFQLVSYNERAIRQALTLAADGAAKIETQQLHDSLRKVEKLAAAIRQ